MDCTYFNKVNGSGYAARFFSIEQSTDVGHPNANHILPDGTAGLLFFGNGSIHRSAVKGESNVRLSKAYLFGQKTNAVWYKAPSSQLSVFGVKLHPTGYDGPIWYSCLGTYGWDASFGYLNWYLGE